MQYDSDVALLGTGVAPLVAASHLLSQGKSVLILNPDWDFFLENSELPLDPLLQGPIHPHRLVQNSPEHALSILRPDFPGAIEFWSSSTSTSSQAQGFHDLAAPHVRQRSRLWISSLERDQKWSWESLEDLYVEASDAGLNPQILEGLPATRRFPGVASNSEYYKGLFIPKLCDVDTVRYRNGLLEFIRERLGSERVICNATQVEPTPEGIRFHSHGSSHTARIKNRILVFWTPRLNPWVLSQIKLNEAMPILPKGIKLWEQWILGSREEPDPSVVGMYGDMVVWTDLEGAPQTKPTSADFSHKMNPLQVKSQLSVLRAGAMLENFNDVTSQSKSIWASAESFNALSNLCHGFLRWDRFSIRALRARAIFIWERKDTWILSQGEPFVQVIPGCDGPLVEVVQTVRTACDNVLKES